MWGAWRRCRSCLIRTASRSRLRDCPSSVNLPRATSRYLSLWRWGTASFSMPESAATSEKSRVALAEALLLACQSVRLRFLSPEPLYCWVQAWLAQAHGGWQRGRWDGVG